MIKHMAVAIVFVHVTLLALACFKRAASWCILICIRKFDTI